MEGRKRSTWAEQVDVQASCLGLAELGLAWPAGLGAMSLMGDVMFVGVGVERPTDGSARRRVQRLQAKMSEPDQRSKSLRGKPESGGDYIALHTGTASLWPSIERTLTLLNRIGPPLTIQVGPRCSVSPARLSRPGRGSAEVMLTRPRLGPHSCRPYRRHSYR